MLKRKLLWCFVISCFLLLMFGTGSQARGREQIIESTEIPEPMQPGSEIVFLDSSHYKILKGGLPHKKLREEDKNLSKNSELEEGLVIREEYPVPKKGVKVTYADDGYINRILYHGEDYEGSDHVEINNVDIGEILSKWTAPVLLFFFEKV